MSVVKNKRSLSRLEFYNTARKLRIDLTNWLLRDFGIRDKVYKFKNDDELEKTLYAEYPKWFIESTRKTMLTILTNLMMNITAANSIYPINMTEVDLRRGTRIVPKHSHKNSILGDVKYGRVKYSRRTVKKPPLLSGLEL